MEDTEEVVDTEDECQMYMACIMQSHRVGIAYYDSNDHRLYVLEVWDDEFGSFPVIALVKYQVKPLVIYTSTKVDEYFLDALQNKWKELPVTEVKLVRSSVFSYEQAWHRLMYLQVSGMEESLNDKERLCYLSSLMNMTSDVQVRAAGGLLAMLQQDLLVDTIELKEYDTPSIRIQGVSEISLYLLSEKLEYFWYRALQIFQVDRHPSCMGIGKAKEGFSLFGMFNKCVTAMGRRLLRSWFLRPIIDLDVLNDRFNTISFFIRCDEMMATLHNCLKSVKDIPSLLKKLRCPSSLSTADDWKALSKSIFSVIYIRRIFEVGMSERQHEDTGIMKLNIVKQVFSHVSNELVQVYELVNGVIDYGQNYKTKEGMIVKSGICQELDELKAIYEELPKFLDEISSSEMQRLSTKHESTLRGSIVYMPQIGYLMCLSGQKLDEKDLEIYQDIEFAFSGGENELAEYFYRSSLTKELDLLLGDIYHKILDLERAIIRDLELRIQPFSKHLHTVANFVGELDCMLSLALVAQQHKYVRPVFSTEDKIEIINGRHVLQEMIVETFVPNDTNIANKGRISVITGPNYSGKSIYIKQVALIVFLSHIGSFVPADSATVSITDRIFCGMTIKHTVTSEQSTFMMDLHQIGMMLRHATSKSLCLIDEFGKGTLTRDGIGLLCATLKYFSNYRIPPKVLVCTHLSELFNDGNLPESDQFAFYTMNILKHNHAGSGEEDIIFLYRLIRGHAVSSYGLRCAELAGVPMDIIKRAAYVLSNIGQNRPLDRYINKNLDAKEQQYKDTVKKFLEFDLENGDCKAFVDDILNP